MPAPSMVPFKCPAENGEQPGFPVQGKLSQRHCWPLISPEGYRQGFEDFTHLWASASDDSTPALCHQFWSLSLSVASHFLFITLGVLICVL